MKSSYYNIGGYEISLYEIENCILRGGHTSKNIYGEIPQFNDRDPKNTLKLEKVEKYIFYGISYPTKSSPALRIYFPNNLNELLKMNAIDFYNKKVGVDMEKSIITIPEYMSWIDPKIFENIFKEEE